MSFRIILLGSPDFTIPGLEALCADQRFEIVGVFTQPDKKVGRKQILTPSAVKKRALELKLPIFTPEKLNTPENVKIIQKLKPDFLFSFAYGQIISNEILAIPKIEPINLHVSLLPKYRGASPVPSCLLNGDQETGITFIRMIDKMDAGAMFYQEKFTIEQNDNAATLFEKMAELGRKTTPEVLTKIAEKKLKPIEQNEKHASYCQKILKENGQINWQTETAAEIFNKIRAYTPWPGCYTKFQGKILKIIKAEKATSFKKVPLEKGEDSCKESAGLKPQLEEDFSTTSGSAKTSQFSSENDAIPGTVIQQNNQIQITTKSGVLIPKIVQLEGKKAMSIEDFTKGRNDFRGTQLGA